MKHLKWAAIFCFAGLAFAQPVEYEGPSILSRGVGPVLGGRSELVRLRPFLTVTGVYDWGLTPVSQDAQGRIPIEDLYGAEAGFGVYGYRTWRRSVLGVDYRGNYRHYNQNVFHNGTDQHLTLGFSHQASRRWTLLLREAAGTYSRNFGLLNAQGFFDPAITGVPTDELFDGRIYYLSTMGDLTFQKSPRLSFNMGGRGLVVRRRSSALVGVTGWMASGDIGYRVNPSNAIGVDYDYTHYDFTRVFGSSDVHTLGFNWAVRLSRRWELGMRGGASRVESKGVQRVAVDPVIAAIIGRTVGIEVFHRVNYIPSVNARLSRAFRHSNLSFNYRRGANPGNGIYLTSQHQSAWISYSYTGFRKWNFGLSSSYTTYSSLTDTFGRYESYRGGAGFTYKLAQPVHLTARFDARRVNIRQSAFQRDHLRASVGLAFSPGDLPLSLW